MMERIAIPVFRRRVSPVLDVCRRMMIVDIDDGIEVDRQQIRVGHLSFRERVELLVLWKVRRIICGGISELMITLLKNEGIEAVGGIAGEVEAIIAAYCCGRLDDPSFCMPGRRMACSEA